LEKESKRLPKLIENPTRVQSAGNMPKIIDEYIGRLNTKESRLSVAHMRSPAGWLEPGQTPEFEEFTLVLRGCLRVRHQGGEFEVRAGQAVITHPGEWIQYSTPDEATEYIAICWPAFSPETVHRD
jgi:ethanolamine utilization protein EutQ (cupin superfamily)